MVWEGEGNGCAVVSEEKGGGRIGGRGLQGLG